MVNKGFVTLEVIIAMMILTLAFASAFLLESSNADVPLAAHNLRNDLNVAEANIRGQEAIAQSDFSSVLGTSLAPFETLITAQSGAVSLSAIVADANDSTTDADCADDLPSALEGDWTHPQTVNATTDFASLAGNAAGNYQLTGMKILNGKLFVTASNASTTKETFFIFDISDPANPALISKFDTDVNASGLMAASVVSNTSGTYAIVANQGSFRRELQVLDLSTSTSVIANYQVPGTTGANLGTAIAFKNNYAYLGLSGTSSPEFDIVDVSNKTAPRKVSGFSLSAGVNAIAIDKNFAYIASPNDEELIILDVSDPSNPTDVAGFNAPGGSGNFGNGKSIFVKNDRAYLGRTEVSGYPEFYVLDASHVAGELPVIASRIVGSSVNTILVRGSLAFVLTTNGWLKIFDVSTSTLPDYAAPVALAGNGKGVALACSGNYIFAASVTAAGSSLQIITSR